MKKQELAPCAASPTKPLDGQVAIITGASRGIGREIALTFAANGRRQVIFTLFIVMTDYPFQFFKGATVVIAAKSTKPQANLPGTIYDVAKEVWTIMRLLR